jgi:hypothetical protein
MKKRFDNVPLVAFGDKGNCTVVAFAAILGADYIETREELARKGIYSKAKGGSKYFPQLNWMRKHRRLVSCFDFMGGTYAAFLRNADPSKTYLVYTDRHCQAQLPGGKVVNTSIKSRSRVHDIFEVLPLETVPAKGGNKVTDMLTALRDSRYTDGVPVAYLARALQLTDKQVRSAIDRARKSGWKIVNNGGRFALAN